MGTMMFGKDEKITCIQPITLKGLAAGEGREVAASAERVTRLRTDPPPTCKSTSSALA